MTASQDNTPIKGAQIAIKTLEKLGVDLIFAYPGGQAIEFHQALKDSSIRVILPRHEQGGAFGADGLFRGYLNVKYVKYLIDKLKNCDISVSERKEAMR